MTEANPAEIALLTAAKGGLWTADGTPELDLAEALEERGWLKVVNINMRGVHWRLSGDGLKVAYADEAAG